MTLVQQNPSPLLPQPKPLVCPAASNPVILPGGIRSLVAIQGTERTGAKKKSSLQPGSLLSSPTKLAKAPSSFTVAKKGTWKYDRSPFHSPACMGGQGKYLQITFPTPHTCLHQASYSAASCTSQSSPDT